MTYSYHPTGLETRRDALVQGILFKLKLALSADGITHLSAFVNAGCPIHGAKRHVWDIQTADEIVRAMYSDFGVPPDAEISFGQPAVSEFTGYDRIAITVKLSTRTQSVDLLVSRDRKTVSRYSTFDLTKDDPRRGVEISRRLGWGNPDAPVQIVAFMDLQCPFCAAMHKQFMTSTLDHYKDTIWITYKSFPLASHDKAMSFAKESECIGEQSVDAYMTYLDALYRPSPQDSNAARDIM